MGRIVFLIRRYCPGEAWTNRILAYAKSFAEMGEDVYLYFLISDKNRTIHYETNIPGITVINLFDSDGFICRRFRHLSFIKNLIKFKYCIESGDRIFIYGGYLYQLRLALSMKEKAKVFCEITEHPNIHGFSKRIERINRYKIKLLKQVDGLFVISNSLKEYYIKMGIDNNKVDVINMFVDIDRFENLKKIGTQKYIAYCGAVSYYKDGCDCLIRSFSIFNKKHPDYKLYIIGKGIEPQVIPSLKLLAQQLGVEGNIVFTGAIPPVKIPQILFNADILALARPNNLQAQYGFPTKLGEYLATGNPVVVTNVGEISDFINDGINGCIAIADNPTAFAEKLDWIVCHPNESRIMGINGKKLVSNQFNSIGQARKALMKIRKNCENCENES